MWDLFKNGFSFFSHKAGKVAKFMCVSKSWHRCVYLRQCVTSYLFSVLRLVWWKHQRPALVCLSSAPECESDPGCSAALLQPQCHRGDHLFYSPKPSGGCWHQHRPAGGVLPPAAQVLSVSAERPPGFSRHQRWVGDCFQLRFWFWRCVGFVGSLMFASSSVLLTAVLFGAVWSITEDECLPGGNLFGVTTLFICALISGKLVALLRLPRLPPFPPLLGKTLVFADFISNHSCSVTMQKQF